jgi:hypothetical protein
MCPPKPEVDPDAGFSPTRCNGSTARGAVLLCTPAMSQKLGRLLANLTAQIGDPLVLDLLG